MSDIDSNLPVRAAVGDVVVNLLGGSTGGVVIDPASEGTLADVLAGVTGIASTVATENTSLDILAGVTGIASTVATENTALDILAGITGLADVAATEQTLASVLAGVTGIAASVATEDTSISILAGVTGIADVVATEQTLGSVLAGVTGIADVVATEQTLASVLAGVTGGNAIATDILAGVTGIEAALDAQLPAVLGATGSDASLSVVMATDQSPIPVYITAGASNTPIVQFKTDANIATNNTSVNVYDPANKFVLNRIQAAGTGRIKVEVRCGLIANIDNAASLKWVGFNSTAMPNVDIDCSDYTLAAGDRVKVVVTNYEAGKTQDLYSTIVGDLA